MGQFQRRTISMIKLKDRQMNFYQFKREQFFEHPIEDLWGFISNPNNLNKITPDMGFEIISDSLNRMYEGMIISYKVSPLFGIKTTWVTEITHLIPVQYFVDEQRIGPFKLWHHQHFLESKNGGTLMTDIVTYKIPLGILGYIANRIIVKRKLKYIFDYRRNKMAEIFND